MATQTTKEQAVEVLQLLTAQHKDAAYFRKAEVVPVDSGYGVDLHVDRGPWEDSLPWRQELGKIVPSELAGVPVCIMVVG